VSEARVPGALRWVPGLLVVRSYRRAWLRHDVAAGLALSALLVPAGMAYAEASGLSPIYGLYATIVPLTVYALFGPSRILVLGPDSSLAPLIAATIIPLAGSDMGERVGAAGALSIISGALLIGLGLARFGFLTDLLSSPVRYGYLNGIALTVIVSQLATLFGFSVDADDLFGELRGFLEGVADGLTNTTALALGMGAVVTIVVLRRLAPMLPGVLVAVVTSLVLVPLFDLADEGLALVGVLPRGLPSFSLPGVELGDLGALFAGAIGVAMVSFADTSVLSRTFALRGDDDVDPSQEMVSLGAANLAAGVFQGFAVSGSSSRTPVAEAAGAKTQLTSLVGAGAIVLLLVLAPGLFRNLPQSVLAAIVITSAIRLVEITGVVKLLRAHRSEFFLSLAAFAGVAILGVIPGIGLAIALAVLNFVRKAWRPHVTSLVRIDGVKGYHDVSRHPEGRRIPGLALLRFDAPLFFANAELFRREVLNAATTGDPPTKWVVVTAEPITDVDATAAEMLVELVDELQERGCVLAFAELKGRVRELLHRYGVVERVGRERFYPTIGQAVKAYVAAEQVPWVDWEDQPGGSP
jgi:high affinity sulfate transporter 1